MMDCQPRRWLWGLLPLAALWLISGWFNHDRVQADLTQRSVTEALKAKAPWASATFDGRDATVNGVAPAPEVKRAAQDAVAAVSGVRLVRDATTVLAEAKPYLWSATRDGAKVTLAGFAPSEEAKAKLVADARAAVPGATVVDEMKVARGAPAAYAAAAAYSLAQIGRLPDGKAQLTDAALAVTGNAPTAEIHQAATAAGLPQGVTGTVTVGLPVARPYVWQAEKQGGTITLTGHAPSAEAKARLLETAAKAGAPGLAVVDRMTLAAGAPAGFDAMAAAAFGHLAGLDRGVANLSDMRYALSGAAPTYDAFARTTEAAQSIPQGFSLSSAAVTAPVVSPYVWSATRDASGVTLSGNVPSPQVRDANLAAARAALPNLAVTDRQQLNAGAPNGFAEMTAYALSQLGRLASGAVGLSDTAFTIAGQAPTMAARGQAAAAAATLPAGFTLASQAISAVPVSPYRWSATREGAAITLSGHVPDEAVKAANVAAARASFPGAAVADRQELAAGAPNGFAAASAFAIARLAGLDQGEASLTDAALAVTGRTATLAHRNAAVAGLSALPAGFALARQDIVAPRIAPFAWSAARAGQTVTLAGYVPDEAAKAANVAAARAAVQGATVVDQQVLGAGAPEGFAGMTAFAIRQLGRLETGAASLTNSAYALTGRAASPVVRDEVTSALARLPAGFSLARQEITAPAPPPPAPPPVVVAPPPAVVAPPAPPEPPAVAVVVPPPPPPPFPAVVPAPPAVTAVDCQSRLDALLTEPVLFDTAESTIRAVSYLLLGRLADAAKSCPGRDIEIAAHTDSDGAADRNQALSERRAQAVVDFLVREGVAASSLRAVGYGQTRPIAPNDTAENKQKNRRVEFTVR